MCPTPTPSEESSKFEGFIGRLRSGQIALGLFEALPEVMFWLKDETGIIIFANRACSDVLRSKPENLVGKTDHDLYPRAMADVYQSDDKKVFRTGKAMHNKLELLTRPGGAIEWRMASKIPLFDLNDTVIGTAGISRRLEHGEGPPLPTPHRAISELIDHVNEHLEEPITVQDLAQRASIHDDRRHGAPTRHLASATVSRGLGHVSRWHRRGEAMRDGAREQHVTTFFTQSRGVLQALRTSFFSPSRAAE